MQQNKYQLLSTRPLLPATISQAATADVHIDCISFIEANIAINEKNKQQILDVAGQYANVAFTSMNAAEAVIQVLSAAKEMPEWSIYCLGNTTLELVYDYWNKEVTTANNAAALANKIIDEGVNSVVFFCGNKRREELPYALNLFGIGVTEIEVYQTILTPLKIEKDYNGILFYSPSGVQSFFSLNKPNSNTILFSIGSTTTNTLKKRTSNKIIEAIYPDKNSLALMAIQHFTNTQH